MPTDFFSENLDTIEQNISNSLKIQAPKNAVESFWKTDTA